MSERILGGRDRKTESKVETSLSLVINNQQKEPAGPPLRRKWTGITGVKAYVRVCVKNCVCRLKKNIIVVTKLLLKREHMLNK